MPQKPKTPQLPLSQTNGLRFVTAPAAPAAPVPADRIEPKAAPHAAAPRPQHAWEMTLDEFRERFFPELCGDAQTSEIESAPQRNAA